VNPTSTCSTPIGKDGQTAEQVAVRAAAVSSSAAGALEQAIVATLAEYNSAAEAGVDSFGKKAFRHAPIKADDTLYAGRIVPVRYS